MKKILFFVLTLTCTISLVNARKITINNTSESMPLEVMKGTAVIAEIAPHGSFSQDIDNPFQLNKPFTRLDRDAG